MGKKGKTSYSPALRHQMKLDAEKQRKKKAKKKASAKSVRELLEKGEKQ